MKKLLFLFLFFLFSSNSNAALDPLGCDTSIDLRSKGYVYVTDYSVTLNNNSDDDLAGIQAAVDYAHANRKVVYFPPGEYSVSGTIKVIQEPHGTNGNDGETRFGHYLVGSYCGSSKPKIYLKNNTDNSRDLQAVMNEPTPIISMWRHERVWSASDGPDLSDGGHAYNLVVRNLELITGNNSGAVCVRNGGAELSAVQEITCNATNGFAGIYESPASGGYTSDINITGGKYAIFSPSGRDGGYVIVGLTASGQTVSVVAEGVQSPLTLVGADITSSTGNIIRYITGSVETNYKDQGGIRVGSVAVSGNVSILDSKINVTGGTNILFNKSPGASIYIRNSYFKGKTKIVDNPDGVGDLNTTSTTSWAYVNEYSGLDPNSVEPGTINKSINNIASNRAYYNGSLYETNTDITVPTISYSIPGDLQSKHLYGVALCNPQVNGVVWADTLGANPDDSNDDSVSIQNAINKDGKNNNIVFLKGGTWSSGAIGHYKISKTISLKENTRLCGLSPFNTVLDATNWTPSSTSPILTTTSGVDDSPVIGDLKTLARRSIGNPTDGYDPEVYSLYLRAGNSTLRNYWGDSEQGSCGDRSLINITGGGKVYGLIQEKSQMTAEIKADNFKLSNPDGTFRIDPLCRNMTIKNNNNLITFYPYHSQFPTPPTGSQIEFINAKVEMMGVKSESMSVLTEAKFMIQNNPINVVPAWLKISGTSNVKIYGYEGLFQTTRTRGIIELDDTSKLTVGNLGRRNSEVGYPRDTWYFIKGPKGLIKADGIVSLYKTELEPYTNEIIDLPPPTGLSLSLSFEEGFGSIVNDSIGTNNGTLTNNPTWNGDGAIGSNSLRFIGSNTGSNQFITIPASEDLLQSNFTLATWIKTEVVPSGTSVVARKIVTSGTHNFTYDILFDSDLKPKFRISNGTSIFSITATNDVSTNSWHLLVGTLQDGEMKFYVDGSLQSTIFTGVSINTLNPGTFRIGAIALSTNQFNGSIDNVELYNYGLTQSEVNSLWSKKNPDIPVDTIDVPSSFKLESSKPTCTMSWSYNSDKRKKIDGFRSYVNDVPVKEFPSDLSMARCTELGLPVGTNNIKLRAYYRSTSGGSTSTVTITR